MPLADSKQAKRRRQAELMLGDDALELEIAILQHGEVRRELATGFGGTPIYVAIRTQCKYVLHHHRTVIGDREYCTPA
jgi:hypothetical protein